MFAPFQFFMAVFSLYHNINQLLGRNKYDIVADNIICPVFI